MTTRNFGLITFIITLALTGQPAGAQQYPVIEGGPLGEGGERYYNFVRCVRDE